MSESQPPSQPAPSQLEPEADWNTPLPAVIPRPTFWPAGLAFGITFLMWGLLTSMVLIAVGGLVFVVSLIGWIGELRLEQRS